MKFKRIGLQIFLRTLFMFAALLIASIAFIKQWYWLDFIMLPVVAGLFYSYYAFYKKASLEVQQFVESVHYRDFTRYFEVKKAPTELQPFRSGFNEINTTFKSISKEKETQFLHLKSILEIVDTGIFSYEMNTGEVLWMNESLKALLHIPYLKTVHSLEKRNEPLYQEIIRLSAGQKAVTTISKDNSSFKVLLSATMFENEGHTFKLIAFQNINEALDEGESKAWQKLLSVMTHEIMNSVAPISSLAETLKGRIADTSLHPENYKEALTDIETGISTIKKRSEGLLKFTETYRNLSKINKINPSKVLVMELFGHVQQLMQPNIDKRNIDFEIILKDPMLSVNVDSGLIEQVLINLLLNAMDAVKESITPKITMNAETINNRVIVKVSDNGTGIEAEILDKIFIPFFSTKKTGNGIGLSLCKQVMMLHRGYISVKSVQNQGTVFILSFEQE
ncbi:MAG: integral rane sensor signal transduction histidine kinase [Bacteroidetes bacterium]|jgi:signal transduction histidine kinase|nr:integral rane sensor signal transduction histidine kinase [Bacteroidota bacterium]